MFPSEKQTEPKTKATETNTCQVCGEDATIVNYGALTCLSCRTFFRRNVFFLEKYSECRYDGNCEVNTLTRKVCKACRLAKCLAVGMSADYIRKTNAANTIRKSTTSKVEEIPIVTIPQQSALDQPPGGDRYLNASDWTIISNVTHAYDAFSPVSQVRRSIEYLNASSTKLEYDLPQSLRLIAAFYDALQSFVCSTPDFKVLTLAEQRSLFQRNMLGVLSVGGMYFMHESGIFDRPESEQIVLPWYGVEVIPQAKFICRQFDCDPVLYKLLLIALAFSTNCYMLYHRGNIDRDSLLLGTFRLLGSQNVYVELIWRYLMHTHGYDSTVQTFSKLVKQLLGVITLSIDLHQHNQVHRTFIDDIIHQTETSKVVDEKAIVPLWGRKS